MNIKPETLDKISKVQERMHSGNRTTAVRQSIEIADMITKHIQDGGRIIMEHGNEKFILKVPGLDGQPS